ncbi:TetR/AcrR family transcriptional regulator [Rhizobium leguminosarum]|uniref:TetR/AcrR family transcriptional regulator n=1 Tax=Rhizobium leguminosarum TaxID=384 RepID=UPI00144148F8|nr:TetR/AcrR family transcriptional regulator [Rhizobium leguminosarum]MBY5868668.1 TetR/AcrR family transcriptional regulator [Rhizobium leguminosarum]NKM08743.1 TetR family transcriptional regulator [Rhizobium leguminosarum bv. viciae]
MSRPRSYDQSSVLNGAMHAFRRDGYQGVSIRDLEDATGLKVGSIYNSFGDKAGLFDAAFEHYNKTVLGGRIDRFAPAAVGIAGLRNLFTSLMHEPNGESYGCLITNSAVELDRDEHAYRHVRTGMDMLFKVFAERLLAAQQDGSLRAGTDPVLAATKLLALYQGLLVLVRAGRDKHTLERLVAAEFHQLENHHDI